MLMKPSVWDFLIDLDMSTHQDVLYLDIRIRLYWQGDIPNLHLVYIPVFNRHTGEKRSTYLQSFFTVSAKSDKRFLWELRLMAPTA